MEMTREVTDLIETNTLGQLRDIARLYEIRGYSGKNKASLARLIIEGGGRTKARDIPLPELSRERARELTVRQLRDKLRPMRITGSYRMHKGSLIEELTRNKNFTSFIQIPTEDLTTAQLKRMTTSTKPEKVKDPKRVFAGQRLAAISKVAKERKAREKFEAEAIAEREASS